MSTVIRDAALRHLETQFEYLIDDPWGFGPKTDVRDVIQAARALAKELGVDFDAHVKKHGSDYEVRRLREIEGL